jgi:Zn-dependent protease
MAAAGPAGNVLLALAAFALLKAGLLAEVFIAPEKATFSSVVVSAAGPTYITTLLSVFLMLNVLLGTFNLLPLPPLDGASVASLFLPDTIRRRVDDFATNGMMSLVGLVVAWRVFPLFTDPLFSLVLRVLHPGLSYH